MSQNQIDDQTRAFYQRVLLVLHEAGVPFLAGGAYAMGCYTGIERHTKDLDIFVRSQDAPRVLERLGEEGLRIERTHPHWLAKAYAENGAFVDVIYSSANGIAPVEDDWFERPVEGRIAGVYVPLCPAEDIIWSKAFVVARERCDIADVAHLIRERGAALDWAYLVRRFGEHWRLLFAHLVLFGYIYPSERETVPAAVMRELMGRMEDELKAGPCGERLCRGTLLAWSDYLVDVEQWDYRDARLPPEGSMTPEDIARWTAAEK